MQKGLAEKERRLRYAFHVFFMPARAMLLPRRQLYILIFLCAQWVSMADSGAYELGSRAALLRVL